MAGPLWDLAIGLSGSFANLFCVSNLAIGLEWNVLWSAEDVTPHDADFVTGLYVDDLAGGGGVRIASKVSIVYVGDGVVGWGDANTVALTKVLAVNSDALGNGVS